MTNIQQLLKNIPNELRPKTQWVCWKAHPERGKVPIVPESGKWAESDNESTWRSFSIAMQHVKKYDGLAFMFKPPFIGVDLDDCIENGNVLQSAQSILKSLNSYSEYSPSKTGFHIIVKGELPKSFKKDGIEIYNKSRFFTMTGDRLLQYPKLIKSANGNLSQIIEEHWPNALHGERRNEPGWVNQVLQNLQPGNLHNSFIKVIGKLHQDGWTKEDIQELLEPHVRKVGGDLNAFEQRLKSVTSYPRDIRISQRQAIDPSHGRFDSPPEPIQIEIVSPSSYFDEYSEHLGDREKFTEPELSTGFPQVDRLTNGLKRTGLWIVGARSSIGKTSFATAIAQNLLERDKRVLFFSTEMPRNDIFDRFISLKTGIPYFDIEKRNLDEESRKTITDYGKQFKSKNLFICDERQPTVRTIDEALSRVRPSLFVFDHIQRITHTANQRYLEIANFVKEINDLCLKFNCAGLINSQLNRVADFERPALHHLKECGALEEEAHIVILLSSLTSFDEQAEKIVLCDIAKHRNGPTGEVKLRFKRNISQFEEVE